MGRWGALPPNKLQRWVALRAVALQIASACLALVAAVAFLIDLRSGGWTASALAAMLPVVVFIGWIPAARQIARFVSDYDRRQAPTPD